MPVTRGLGSLSKLRPLGDIRGGEGVCIDPSWAKPAWPLGRTPAPALQPARYQGAPNTADQQPRGPRVAGGPYGAMIQIGLWKVASGPSLGRGRRRPRPSAPVVPVNARSGGMVPCGGKKCLLRSAEPKCHVERGEPIWNTWDGGHTLHRSQCGDHRLVGSLRSFSQQLPQGFSVVDPPEGERSRGRALDSQNSLARW